jgi:acyl-CoA synthetase (AMP-forming)/AMP-acid ligase II
MSVIASSEQTAVMLAPDLLRLCAAEQPDLAPINVDGRESITYRDWDLRSNAVAHVLVDRGVQRGDRVALFFGGMDWVDYTIAYFGVLKAGATATHLNDLLEPDELRRRLGHAAAVGMVYGVAMTPPPDFAGWTATVGELDGNDETPVAVDLHPEDIADIVYTGGTTGPAKALANPHGNLTFGRGLKATAKASFDGSAPLLLPMPLGSSYSAGTVGIFALTTTVSIVVCPPDDVERMAELIEQYRIGSAMLPPWVAMRMVAEQVGERHDLSSITTVGVASAPMPPRFANALLAMMPNAKMVSAYGGGSEAVPANITTLYDPARPTLMGRPVAGTDLLVVDADGDEVPLGGVGEMLLRTAAPKRFYLDRRLNEKIHAADGFVRTGDLGYLDAGGELHFFDRGADAIRIGGELVSSIEIENAIYEQPAVREAAVVAVTDPELGVLIVAAVVLVGSEGAPDGPQLRSLVAQRLAPHKVPAVVHLLDELPRGRMSSKVLKQLLRQRFSAA